MFLLVGLDVLFLMLFLTFKGDAAVIVIFIPVLSRCLLARGRSFPLMILLRLGGECKKGQKP